MPIGASKRCSICTSPIRAEIDQRLLRGESGRTVSAWLASIGERRSHVAINEHKRAHLNVLEEAKSRLAGVVSEPHPDAPPESQKAFDGRVREAVNAISTLDEIVSMAMTIARRMQTDMGGESKMPQVALYTGCLREAREAAKVKHELLNGDGGGDGFAGLAEALGQAFSSRLADGGDAPPPLASPA